MTKEPTAAQIVALQTLKKNNPMSVLEAKDRSIRNQLNGLIKRDLVKKEINVFKGSFYHITAEGIAFLK